MSCCGGSSSQHLSSLSSPEQDKRWNSSSLCQRLLERCLAAVSFIAAAGAEYNRCCYHITASELYTFISMQNQLVCLVTSAMLFTSRQEIACSPARSSQHEALCSYQPCASFCAFRQSKKSWLHLPSAVVGVFQMRRVPIALCYQEEQWFVSDLPLDHNFSTGSSALWGHCLPPSCSGVLLE